MYIGYNMLAVYRCEISRQYHVYMEYFTSS